MIEVENLSKTFKVAKRSENFLSSVKSLFKRKYILKQALKDVSFNITEGEIVGYIGPNGAGKSTTIKILCGILTPTSGTCVVNGLVPWQNRIKYVKNIGAVFGQRSNLNWDIPIIDSYELLKEIYRIPDDEYERNLKNLTQKLKLQELLNVPLRQLSLGQKMRCEIAAALLHSPKILFLDEPTIGLDSVSKLAVRDFIKQINSQTKVTVILTTHDMSDIEALTNRVILIGKGQILYDGAFDEIKKKYGKVKNIEVEFEEIPKDLTLKNYELICVKDKVATFENLLPGFNMTKFIQELEKNYKVVDVSISAMNTEEIVSEMYKEFDI